MKVYAVFCKGEEAEGSCPVAALTPGQAKGLANKEMEWDEAFTELRVRVLGEFDVNEPRPLTKEEAEQHFDYVWGEEGTE